MAMGGVRVLGPVFAWEWQAASRRWQGYAMRSLLVLLMLIGLSAVWAANANGAWALSARDWAVMGRGFYAATTLILLGLVGLAAPAATAGAICVDKGRGNLTLNFASDLTNSEIVLGKLAARLTLVFGLVGSAAPVLSLSTLLGGVGPSNVLGAILICLACGIFGSSLALMLSVWGRKPHEVLLATYAFGIAWLLSAPIWAAISSNPPSWAQVGWLPRPYALFPFNPVFLTLAPLGAPAVLGPSDLSAQARFFGLGMAASAVLIAAATWRIRPVVIERAGRAERVGRLDLPGILGRWGRWIPSPSLDRNPVLWREWHRRRLSWWSVAVWGVYVSLAGLSSLWTISAALDWGGPVDLDTGAFFNGVQVAVGLLLMSVSAATSLAEERQRGSLDVLLATPLPTRQIVLGKWWGAFRGVPLLAILPTLVAAALATHTGFLLGAALICGLILAYGAALISLGLAVATWIPGIGQVIGRTTGLYVAVLIGSIAIGIPVTRGAHEGLGQFIAAASPLWGVGYSGALFGGTAGGTHLIAMQAFRLFLWIALYGLVALGLILATLMAFNRCLGRVDDTTVHPRIARRPAVPKKTWVPDAGPS